MYYHWTCPCIFINELASCSLPVLNTLVLITLFHEMSMRPPSLRSVKSIKSEMVRSLSDRSLHRAKIVTSHCHASALWGLRTLYSCPPSSNYSVCTGSLELASVMYTYPASLFEKWGQKYQTKSENIKQQQFPSWPSG